MLIYQDINSLREICSSYSKESIQSKNNAMVILYHYDTRTSLLNALMEFDIDVDTFEADRSLLIRDADEILFRSDLASFIQYLKSLQLLAIKSGKNGVDIVIDMGPFQHFGKEKELVKYENALNNVATTSGSRSSIVCCYHDNDVKGLDRETMDDLHLSHLTSYVVKEEQ
jgi:hypothetical protein